MPDPARVSDDDMLASLQRETLTYFDKYVSEETGLTADRSAPDSPSSIAAVGLGVSALCVGVERGFMPRAKAASRILALLRFLSRSEQSDRPDATGYKGFYYHFLDMKTGRRAPSAELSSVDTALLMGGVLTAGRYFDRPTPEESEIRELTEALYRRVEWTWLATPSGIMSHGWTPEGGQLPWSWDNGYSEALLLYVLALGSPTFAIPEQGYRDWTETFERKVAYDIDYLYAGPLFIHQLSHVWIDFRGIRDARTRAAGFDYFENSRRATLVQQAYAIDNPHGFAFYSRTSWGLTASDGPGPAVRVIDGVERTFFGYLARGAPFGPDDGTISPWAVVASLPFAPEIVCPTIRHLSARLARRSRPTPVGLDASFNPTFLQPTEDRHGWASPWKFGLNEGPIVLMIENHRSEMIWRLIQASPYVVSGLRRAGFEGGWLDQDA